MTKAQTKRLDELWKKLVKQRAHYTCEYSGKTKDQCQLHPHHIFSRSNRAVRWDMDNGICLSASWHTLGTFSAHKAPLIFADWLIEKRGRKWYNKLKAKAKSVCKADFEEVSSRLLDYQKMAEDKDCDL